MNNEIQFLSIGADSVVSLQRLIAVLEPDSAPVRRMIQEARDRGTLIDASFGKKTRAVLVMDSDHIVLSAREAGDIRDDLSGHGSEH